MKSSIAHLPTARAKSEVYLKRVEREKAYRQMIHQLVNSNEDRSAGMRFRLQDHFGFEINGSFL